ncbi:tRNA pseudouridine(38-40) synthase TruA [Paramagnetospirillum magneticum]|uniref:tRNA pseudouridine synthase A n=1 Tax=Paramagnetospirillum magneticum (strain ATCC 700264 / AMB-1) TaxID=342108 RepID=TRUA_PARM1|nr:tRNA pseudouridine(38-40) synthase TruA [Paramagnetospirillum magneticum]Q2WAT0.1 RecName: Full=tRNA pseudouridine synthase A; AltName: Full=tRNA pseudouridine(38-40) synthase; AltName: Full=tRNA pseudouridylate synthase I; AltName: Full=tRNA-uridine isomerase I [Paramagnetospirillum magneticum AMB-1]BAE49045.1 Pseudouridylate synthase [Paramagnetospirillum magneticum AMB-1]
MPRYRLLVEYDGTPFNGWQRQDKGLSVQGILEKAVEKLCGVPCTLHAAGRTDAGVHATGQVAHVDLPRDYPADTVRDALNYHMKPKPVAVVAAELVDEDFHARFSAVGRAYLYRIVNRRAPLALDQHRAWWVPVALDAEAMAEGARRLLGHHDFSTFRASECQAKSPMKTLDVLDVTRVGEEIRIVAEARSFLHHQVRNMVGTLKLVGEGKWSPDDMAKVLEARDRTKGGPTAPAAGLVLTGVSYSASGGKSGPTG